MNAAIVSVFAGRVRELVAVGRKLDPGLAAEVGAAEVVLAEHLAAEVVRTVDDFVSEDERAAVLRRLELGWRVGGRRDESALLRWPLFDEHTPIAAAAALGRLVALVRRSDAGAVGGGWPVEVAPLDVAKWARAGLDAADRRNIVAHGNRVTSKTEYAGARDLRWVAEIGGALGEWSFYTPDNEWWRYPAAGLALVYVARRRCREMSDATEARPPTSFPVDVGTPMQRTSTGLMGADPAGWYSRNRAAGRAEVRSRGPDVREMIFRWGDEPGRQVTLKFDTEADLQLPFLAISRRFGDVAVRDLMALSFFGWAARRPAGDPFWWWPGEHLEIVKVQDETRRRRELVARIEELARSTLEVHYKKGDPLVGPVVTRLLSQGDTVHRLALHPGLFQGVTTKDNEPGSYFWQYPIELLARSAAGGPVHAAAIQVGHLLRAAQSEHGAGVASIGVAELVARLRLGGGRRSDRVVDPRVGAALRGVLLDLEAMGVIRLVDVERGNLDRCEGVVRFTAGEQQAALFDGDSKIARPAWLPSTGEDVERWQYLAGYTDADAAARLGLSVDTLKSLRREARRGRVLTEESRAAFRRLLWGPAGG